MTGSPDVGADQVTFAEALPADALTLLTGPGGGERRGEDRVHIEVRSVVAGLVGKVLLPELE